QLRQLAMYAHAAGQPDSGLFKPDLKRHFDTVLATYKGPSDGLWIYSVDDEDKPADTTLDLYTHAFVIFAFSHYSRTTGDASARLEAASTLQAIDRNFRKGVMKGFAESLDLAGNHLQAVRRHESHMHLLEACLFANEVWNDAAYMRIADEIVGLFLGSFYDSADNMLSEYFTDDLRPRADIQRHKVICEAGHYYEWIWLLKKYAHAKATPDAYDDICKRMLDWANTHGWDQKYGGIYDELDAQGQVVQETKRLWPFTEGLKANALMLNIVADRDAAKEHMARMTALFRDKYIDERGFWTEWLERDLTPAVDYMPATTPYHVYFGIMETRDILRSRGASKSWRAGPRKVLYKSRRLLSTIMRNTRRKLLK
ncbi:MAG: AGE family epimerase/isomerase, partial [Alphaproteobacteria bacterium]|nr:AGE family epimerase/isomerase [Alphaproteobacteria bacterium]